MLLRNRQIHGEFTVIPSLENRFVAVMVVAVIVEPHNGTLNMPKYEMWKSVLVPFDGNDRINIRAFQMLYTSEISP